MTPPSYNDNDLEQAKVVGGLAEQIKALKLFLDRLDLALGNAVDRMDTALNRFNMNCLEHRASESAKFNSLEEETDTLKRSDRGRNKTLRLLKEEVTALSTNINSTFTSINDRLAIAEKEAKRLTWIKSTVILITGVLIARLPVDTAVVFKWVTDMLSTLVRMGA